MCQEKNTPSGLGFKGNFSADFFFEINFFKIFFHKVHLFGARSGSLHFIGPHQFWVQTLLDKDLILSFNPKI